MKFEYYEAINHGKVVKYEAQPDCIFFRTMQRRTTQESFLSEFSHQEVWTQRNQCRLNMK